METTVDALWATYQVNRDPAIRARLIEIHLPLVDYVARRMIGKMHSSVEVQDLVSYGYFGLINAVERFDPNAGVKFATFANYRIEGAITDELRSQAWEPRSVRSRYRKVVNATAALEHKLGRLPTEDEVATAVGIPVAELRRIESDVETSRMTSLSGAGQEDSDQGYTRDVAVDDGAELLPQMEQAASRLANGLGHLSEHEQLLLRLIYIAEVPLKEIARELGVTESWVSHLHTKVMVRLQRTMAAQF